MEYESLNSFESETNIFDADLFWFDSTTENYETQSPNYDFWVDEWLDYSNVSSFFNWDSNSDISGTSSNTEVVGTEFDYEQIDFDLLIGTLIEIFAPDAPDGFIEALEEALQENSEELIFRDGYGRELTDEEIEQIEGIGN
ncbi:MAG TPA: hypothetical protein ACFCUY_18875 [Xenococcaceae cyanobacterium]